MRKRVGVYAEIKTLKNNQVITEYAHVNSPSVDEITYSEDIISVGFVIMAKLTRTSKNFNEVLLKGKTTYYYGKYISFEELKNNNDYNAILSNINPIGQYTGLVIAKNGCISLVNNNDTIIQPLVKTYRKEK